MAPLNQPEKLQAAADVVNPDANTTAANEENPIDSEEEIAANWKSVPKDTSSWAVEDNQRVVRVSGADPVKMTDLSYGGSFIDANGRTNLRLIYSEATIANNIWARALFNFGELSQYIDYDRSQIFGKRRGPFTLERFNGTDIGILNIQDPAMYRASNRSNLPINLVLKEGVSLTDLADKNYPVEMRVTDVDGVRIYAHAPGDTALDYSTYTSSTVIPIKDQISSRFLKGGFQPASKDIARQKSFMTEFIANPEQYSDLSNTGLLRTEYFSNRMFAIAKPTMYGEEAAFTQIFDIKLLDYMKEDDRGNVGYVNVLTDGKKMSPYSQNVPITRDKINVTADGKYAYVVIGPEGFNREGVKVVNIPKHDQYTILEGFYFTAIDYVIDKDKISADPEIVNENKLDFSVSSGFTNPNKAGWAVYETTIAQDRVLSNSDSIILDIGEIPDKDQIMVQIADDQYNFVHTTHGYYNGSYDSDAANFAQLTETNRDGVYQLSFNEGRTLKAGQTMRVYLPYDSEGQAQIFFGDPTVYNATELNGGAATLTIQNDRNINMHLYKSGSGGGFKLKYTLKDGTPGELDFSKGGLWQYNDTDNVLTGVPNRSTLTTGGNFYINTKQLLFGSDIIVEAYDSNWNLIDGRTSYVTYRDNKPIERTENYKGLTWVDQTNTSSVGSIIKSLYVPYQEVFTNDYIAGADDVYANPNLAPAKAADFMKNTTNIIGYTKYDGGNIRLRYTNPQNITYIGKTQAAANEYNNNGEITTNNVVSVTVDGKNFLVFPYDIDLTKVSELRAPGDGSAPKLYKDMKLLFNASDGSSLPSNTVETRVRTRVLFDATDGQLASGESAVRVVPDNVKYYGEEGYVANGFAGDNIQAGTGDSFVSNPTAADKTFLGWVTAEGKAALGDKTTATSQAFNELDSKLKFTDTTPVESHQIVYAIWSQEELVTFNANGGSFADGSSTKTDDLSDGLQEPQAPTQAGKVFKGWATTADATAPDVDLATLNQPTTVYAVWEDEVKITIDESAKKTVSPTEEQQGSGVIVNNSTAATNVSATDEDGQNVPAVINPATGEVELTPGQNVDGPITVTVTDPDLPNGSQSVAVEVEGHQANVDDNRDKREVVGTVNTVKPTDDKQQTGLKITNKSGITPTRATARDEMGRAIGTEISAYGDISVRPGTEVDGPITLVITDPDLPGGSQTFIVPVEGHTADVNDNPISEKHEPQAKAIDKEYGQTTTEQEIVDAVTITPEYVAESLFGSRKPEIIIDNTAAIPDGTTSGSFEVPVTVKYPDNSEDKINVTVVVGEDPSIDTTAPVITADNIEVIEGQAITPASVTTDEEATVTVEGLPTGLSYNPETKQIEGTVAKDSTENWGAEESKDISATVRAVDASGNESTQAITVSILRDTDGDGTPDVVDTDDDGDGVSDEEEIAKGTDPKDDSIRPAETIQPIERPTISNGSQTSVENTPIEDVVITPADPDTTVEVSALPDGLTYDPSTGTISGTPSVTDWGADEEERELEITVTTTNPDGSSSTDTVTVKVQRDTDGDGTPDVVDPDDDGDGVSDEEEIAKGTDPKDDSIRPAETIDEDTTLDLTAPTAVEVQDPAHLTDAEKAAVEEAVRQANPDLPADATVEVADNGDVTVTDGNKSGIIPANQVIYVKQKGDTEITYPIESHPIVKEIGDSLTEADVIAAIKVVGLDEGEYTVTINEGQELPTTDQAGDAIIDVTITYADGTTDAAQVWMIVREVENTGDNTGSESGNQGGSDTGDNTGSDTGSQDGSGTDGDTTDNTGTETGANKGEGSTDAETPGSVIPEKDTAAADDQAATNADGKLDATDKDVQSGDLPQTGLVNTLGLGALMTGLGVALNLKKKRKEDE